MSKGTLLQTMRHNFMRKFCAKRYHMPYGPFVHRQNVEKVCMQKGTKCLIAVNLLISRVKISSLLAHSRGPNV